MANRLREERERKGFTQEHMAKEIGMPRPSSYAAWERGSADKQFHKLIRLSVLLACDIHELFPLPDDEVSAKS